MASLAPVNTQNNLNYIAQLQEAHTAKVSAGAQTLGNIRSQTANLLSTNLSNLSTFFTNKGNIIATQEGKASAIENVAKQIAAAKERKDLAAVEIMGNPESNYSVYGVAYNTAYDAAFTAAVEAEAKGTANRLKGANLYDPDKFQQEIEIAEKQFASKASSPAAKMAVTQAFKKYGDTALGDIVKKVNEMQYDSNKKSYLGHVDQLAMEFKVAIANKDFLKAGGAYQQLSTLQQKVGMPNLFQSEGEIFSFNQKLIIEGQQEQDLANFDGTTESYREYAKSESPLLDYTAKAQVLDKMLKRIDQDVKLHDREEKEEKDAIEKTYVLTAKDFNVSWINGNLTQDELDIAFKEDRLNNTDYQRLSKLVADPGAKYDNTDQLLKLETNILAVSEEDIMSANLTNKTKRDLLLKRKERFKSNKDQWASTPAAREAYKRIAGKFNILENNFLMQLSGEAIKGYDEVRREFYDSVVTLPVEDRTDDTIVNLADQAIANYENKKSEQARIKKEEKKKKDEEKRKAAELEEKNSTWYKIKEEAANWAKDAFELNVEE